MIIVVSDVHLGYDLSDETSFKNFLFNYVSETLSSDDHFVLLGDILDFWRRKNIDTLLENNTILEKIFALATNVHYIVGNHDYYMLTIKERFPEYQSLDLRKYLRLEDAESKFFFIHGYELDVFANYEPLTLEEYEEISENLCQTGNTIGRIFDILWGVGRKLQKPPDKRKSWRRKKGLRPSPIHHMSNLEKFACSPCRNLLLGLKKDEKLVFGHTHNPFINENTANSGSWVKEGFEYDTFIQIEDGRMEKKRWIGEKVA